MKQSPLLATFVAMSVCLGFSISPSAAQQPQHGVGQIAILDLSYVFKNHTRFKALTADMRRDVEAAENQLKATRDSYQTLVRRLEDYNKGTPEYKALEEDIAKRQAEISLQVNITKKNFLEQEAKIYYDVYEEIINYVKYYADNAGIALVLRFNGDPVDRNDPQNVLKELNKTVLHYHQSIDITPIILDRLNSNAPRPTTPNVSRGTNLPQGVFPK